MITMLFYCLFSYLIGSIPCGLLLTKLWGYGDIRTIGSGNIGATNVLRTGNKKLAALTLLLDGLKGFIPLLFIANGSPLCFLGGIFVILGHIFPVWLKFNGGKGVATAIGTLFAIKAFLAACIIALWLRVFYRFRISSLSALSAFAGTTFIALFCGGTYFMYMLVVTLLIFATHRSNIARLLQGKEHEWSKSNEPS